MNTSCDAEITVLKVFYTFFNVNVCAFIIISAFESYLYCVEIYFYRLYPNNISTSYGNG